MTRKIDTVYLKKDQPAQSKVIDTGCGCCSSEIEPEKIRRLEGSIQQMKKVIKDAEKVLEARKKQYKQIGEDVKLEKDVECADCGRQMTRNLQKKVFFSTYKINNKYYCKPCIRKNPDYHRDGWKIYKEVEQ